MSLSQISLGTAQLTMEYGIAQKSIKKTKSTAFKLLKSAIENNITTWDTSPFYGSSEKVIGEYLSKNNEEITICTKLPSISCNSENNKNIELEKLISKNIRMSLKALKTEKIDYYLIHDEQDFIKYGDDLIYFLIKNKEKGKIKNIGVSVYSTNIAELALKNKEIKLLQFPLNIFDTRFNSILKMSAAKEKKMIARSIFLQGLFFLSDEDCKQKMKNARPYLRSLISFCKIKKLSINEMALRYILSYNGISSMVLGMESPDELKKNQKYVKKSKLPNHLFDELIDEFKNVPIQISNPNYWSK